MGEGPPNRRALPDEQRRPNFVACTVTFYAARLHRRYLGENSSERRTEKLNASTIAAATNFA